jgi:hypothetical protein
MKLYVHRVARCIDVEQVMNCRPCDDMRNDYIRQFSSIYTAQTVYFPHNSALPAIQLLLATITRSMSLHDFSRTRVKTEACTLSIYYHSLHPSN